MKQKQMKIIKAGFAVLLGSSVVAGKYLYDSKKTPTVILTNAESTEIAAETSGSQTDISEAASSSETDLFIPIYISGAVGSPGIHEIRSGSYLYEALSVAGGTLDTAAKEYLHMVYQIAVPVSIYIPTYEEIERYHKGDKEDLLDSGISLGVILLGNYIPQAGSEAAPGSSLVNLNTATAEQLQTLPGVGESTAQKIIDYREAHGAFSVIEDIMQVPGIKGGRFEAIRDLIEV